MCVSVSAGLTNLVGTAWCPELQSAARRTLDSLGPLFKGGGDKNRSNSNCEMLPKSRLKYVKGKRVCEAINNKEKPKVKAEGQRRIRRGVVSLDGATQQHGGGVSP